MTFFRYFMLGLLAAGTLAASAATLTDAGAQDPQKRPEESARQGSTQGLHGPVRTHTGGGFRGGK
ncbi:MAG: hypothetical protein HY897_02090 [Deltaproteobacteria bacterium]|nr:hypothetical protein [Deltaproteobacteria bacterium]